MLVIENLLFEYWTVVLEDTTLQLWPVWTTSPEDGGHQDSCLKKVLRSICKITIKTSRWYLAITAVDFTGAFLPNVSCDSAALVCCWRTVLSDNTAGFTHSTGWRIHGCACHSSWSCSWFYYEDNEQKVFVTSVAILTTSGTAELKIFLIVILIFTTKPEVWLCIL